MQMFDAHLKCGLSRFPWEHRRLEHPPGKKRHATHTQRGIGRGIRGSRCSARERKGRHAGFHTSHVSYAERMSTISGR